MLGSFLVKRPEEVNIFLQASGSLVLKEKGSKSSKGASLKNLTQSLAPSSCPAKTGAWPSAADVPPLSLRTPWLQNGPLL